MLNSTTSSSPPMRTASMETSTLRPGFRPFFISHIGTLLRLCATSSPSSTTVTIGAATLSPPTMMTKQAPARRSRSTADCLVTVPVIRSSSEVTLISSPEGDGGGDQRGAEYDHREAGQPRVKVRDPPIRVARENQQPYRDAVREA